MKKKCDWCGKEFTGKGVLTTGFIWKLYCSEKCKYEAKKAGK